MVPFSMHVFLENWYGAIEIYKQLHALYNESLFLVAQRASQRKPTAPLSKYRCALC